jgi:hypothetical protein
MLWNLFDTSLPRYDRNRSLPTVVTVLEYCEGGSLYAKLQNKEFNLKQKIKLIEGIAQGMAHLRM